MTRRNSWTAKRVAARLLALAEEHGVPNRFQLCEVDPFGEPGSALAISRTARLRHWEVNLHLKASGIEASYAIRCNGSPARIIVEKVADPSAPASVTMNGISSDGRYPK